MILAYTYRGIVIYIVRRVLKDLKENHMEQMALEYPEFDAFYRPGDYEYDLPNKSRVVFVYAETKIDVNRVSYGPQCTFLFVDQAEQFTEDELISFRICNRWPSAPQGFAKTVLFFNAGVGIGAGYLRRVFWRRQFSGNERPGDYAFLQMYGWDNFEWFRGQGIMGEHGEITSTEFYELSSTDRFELFVNRTSEGRKMNALPKYRRESELLGNFDSFGGQYFSDVWGDHCILTEAMVDGLMQSWWQRWMAQDWGFGDHDCHLWFVTGKVSPQVWTETFGGSAEWPIDVVIVYRELIVAGRAEADLANDIVSMTPQAERRQIRDFFLSEDAFGKKARQQGANTIGQQFTDIMRRYGMPEPSKADQDRINGWRFMYNCIRQAGLRGCNVDTERAKQGPAMFISAACPNVIDNIPLAVRDEDDINDVMRVPGELWEDVTDAVRYGLKSKLAPKQTAPVEVRRQELFQSVPDPTNRHIAMMHFEEAEKRKSLVTRGPRWR